MGFLLCETTAKEQNISLVSAAVGESARFVALMLWLFGRTSLFVLRIAQSLFLTNSARHAKSVGFVGGEKSRAER